MKKYFFYLLLVLVYLFASCKENKHKEAYKLNNTIQKTNDSLFSKVNDWKKLMAFAVSSGDYSKLKRCRINLEKFLDTAKNNLTGLQDISGSEDFRKSEIKFLILENRIVSQDFAPFEKLKYNTPMDKVSGYVAKLQADEQEEQKLLDQLKTLQDSFAEKNGFKFVDK